MKKQRMTDEKKHRQEGTERNGTEHTGMQKIGLNEMNGLSGVPEWNEKGMNGNHGSN